MNSFEKMPGDNAPEETLQEKAPEQNLNERIFRIGDKEYHSGEKVVVMRSDGRSETDWELKSIGGKFAVVEKVDMDEGGVFRKVVSVDQFADWQNSSQEKGGGINKAMDMRMPEGKAKLLETAKKMGIDTTKSDWEAELNKKIREITGV